MTHEVKDRSPGAEIDGFFIARRSRARLGGMGALFRVTKPGIERPLVMKLPRLGPSEPSEASSASRRKR